MSGSPRRRILWLGLCLALLPCPSCPAAVIQMGAQKFPFTWEVVPAVVRPGDPYTVRVAKFSSQEFTCELMAGRESRKLPCGSKEASWRLTAPALDDPHFRRGLGGVRAIGMAVCLRVYGKRHDFECGGPLEDLQLKLQGEAAPAVPAILAPAAADAPPATAELAPLLRPLEEKPAAPRQASPQPAPEPQDDAAAARKLHVRALDGRTREVEPGHGGAERARQRKSFQLSLLKDEAVRAAYDGWSGLDDAARRQALARVIGLHSQAYGMAPPELVFRKLPGGACGMFKDGGSTLYIDDTMKGWDDPDKVFGVAAHEDAHHYQQELVKKLDAGALKPGDADFEQARRFKEGMADYCSPSGSGKRRQCSIEEYRGQAVERDAIEEGEGVTRSLRSQAAREALARQEQR